MVHCHDGYRFLFTWYTLDFSGNCGPRSDNTRVYDRLQKHCLVMWWSMPTDVSAAFLLCSSSGPVDYL
jgi:hypothetical protein